MKQIPFATPATRMGWMQMSILGWYCLCKECAWGFQSSIGMDDIATKKGMGCLLCF